MEPHALTVEFLKGIRDEARTTNVRLESVERAITQRLESVERAITQRLESVEREVKQHLEIVESEIKQLRSNQVEVETRLASELVAVVGAVNEVRDLLCANAELWGKVENHEQRLSRIEARLPG